MIFIHYEPRVQSLVCYYFLWRGDEFVSGHFMEELQHFYVTVLINLSEKTIEGTYINYKWNFVKLIKGF